MKTSLAEILDRAAPQELESVAAFLQEPEIPQETLQRIQRRVCAQTGIGGRKASRGWLAYVSVAASFCLIVGVILGVGLFDKGAMLPVQSGEAEQTEQTEQPGKELPKALSVGELLAREDYAGIVWGKGMSEDNVPTPDGLQSGNGDGKPLEHVLWNGIALSSDLYDLVTNGDPDTILAITCENLVPNNAALEDFVYNGKVYAQYFEPWAASNQAVNNLQGFCKIATRYEKWNQGEDAFWEKLHEDVAGSEQLVAQYFDGERFLIDQIKEEIKVLQAIRDQHRDEWHACYYAFCAQQTPIELLLFVEQGYYVVENSGRFVVFVHAQDMQTFAQDVIAAYGETTVALARFRFATPDELGIEPEPVPGGVAEQVPEIE